MRRKKKAKQISVSERAENIIKRSTYQGELFPDNQEPTSEYIKIAKWLKRLRFRKKIFGGVKERDVWKKIGELNTMYEAALTAERIRYDTLIEHYRKTVTTSGDADRAADEIDKIIVGIPHKSHTKDWL